MNLNLFNMSSTEWDPNLFRISNPKQEMFKATIRN